MNIYKFEKSTVNHKYNKNLGAPFAVKKLTDYIKHKTFCSGTEHYNEFTRRNMRVYIR